MLQGTFRGYLSKIAEETAEDPATQQALQFWGQLTPQQRESMLTAGSRGDESGVLQAVGATKPSLWNPMTWSGVGSENMQKLRSLQQLQAMQKNNDPRFQAELAKHVQSYGMDHLLGKQQGNDWGAMANGLLPAGGGLLMSLLGMGTGNNTMAMLGLLPLLYGGYQMYQGYNTLHDPKLWQRAYAGDVEAKQQLQQARAGMGPLASLFGNQAPEQPAEQPSGQPSGQPAPAASPAPATPPAGQPPSSARAAIQGMTFGTAAPGATPAPAVRPPAPVRNNRMGQPVAAAPRPTPQVTPQVPRPAMPPPAPSMASAPRPGQLKTAMFKAAMSSPELISTLKSRIDLNKMRQDITYDQHLDSAAAAKLLTAIDIAESHADDSNPTGGQFIKAVAPVVGLAAGFGLASMFGTTGWH